MKKKSLVSLVLIVVIATVYFAKSNKSFNEDFEKTKVRGIGEERRVFIQEIASESFSKSDNSQKSIENLRGFISYIFGNTPNLFFNEEEQNKRFSVNLRSKLKRHLLVYEYGNVIFGESSFLPDNSTFVGYWDYPTNYKILGLQENKQNIEIDIQYLWGKGTNYEGTNSRVTFFFVFENEEWKIDEVFHHKAEYSNESYLSEIPLGYWFNQFQ